MKNKLPDIFLSYEDRIPDSVFEGLIENINKTGASFKKEKRPSGDVYAGVEWYIPTVVILFVGSSFFGGFFQEMGKDTYHLLESGLESIKNKFFGKNPEYKFYPLGTTDKVTTENIFSIGFSLMAQSKTGEKIKFLFFQDPSEKLYEKTINCFIQTLINYYSSDGEDFLSKELSKLKKIPHTILIYYNPKTDSAEVIDNSSLIEIEKIET